MRKRLDGFAHERGVLRSTSRPGLRTSCADGKAASKPRWLDPERP